MTAITTPEATTRRLTGEERRAQLLGVAAMLFAKRGYRSTTMDDVAEAAGVTKPLLYQHFSSKRALYLELVDALAFQMLAEFSLATSSAAGPKEQVELSLRAYFRMMVDDPAAFRLLNDRDHGDDEELGRAIRQVERALVTAIDPLIDAGLERDHRIVLAGGMLGMAIGASSAWTELGDDDWSQADERARHLEADRIAQRVADLMWAGLRAVHAD